MKDVCGEKTDSYTIYKQKFKGIERQTLPFCGCYLLDFALCVINPNPPIGCDFWVVPVYMELILSFADIPV